MSSLSPRLPRLRPTALVLILVLGIAALPARSQAQYMYLDSNGDGVHTAADVVNPTGTTTFDVYLITDQNADGSHASCQWDGEELDIGSYTVGLRAMGGEVTWGSPINRVPSFGVSFGFASNTTEMFYGVGGGFVSPGTYRLMTGTVTVVTSVTGIEIVPRTTVPGGYTLGATFGSHCVGNDGDNTLKLGVDWFDVAGLPLGDVGPPNSGPTLAGLRDITVSAGELVGQPVTATDPDGQIITISLLDGPDYMSLTTVSKERGSAEARINLSPVRADLGSAVGTVSASDGESSTPGSFAITVVNGPNHPTQLAPIGALAVACGRILAVPIHARDPDGEVLAFSKISGPSFLAVTTLANGRAAAAGLVRLAPAICDAGAHEAIIGVGDGALSDQEQLRITVALPVTITNPERRFPVARPPMEVTSSDFNGDGNIDLAAVGGSPGVITVLLGDGNGQFDTRTEISDVGYALRIRSGDWNGDGAADLGTIDFLAGQLSIFGGRGDGSFAPKQVLPAGGRPQDFLSADLNGDGLHDMVVANSSSEFVSVYLAKAGGGFDVHSVPTPGTAFCVAAADMNGDGRLDLAVGTFAHRSISIHLGNGDGAFQDGVEFSVPADPYMISTADLDGDGASDLVVADYDGAILNLMGDGKGTFVAGTPMTGFGTSPTASLADLNGDGHTDIAVVGPENAGVTTLFGDGSGAFPARAQVSPSGGLRVSLADVNDDAIPDLLLPGTGFGASVLIRLNTIGAGAAVEARAFLKDPNRTRPGAGGSPFCLRVEPVNESYTNTDVNYSSLALVSEGTGSLSRINATPSKSIIEGDTDGNGVPEIAACFAGADLSKLFDQVSGRRAVHVSLEGAVTDGRRFCSGFDMTVVGTGGHLAATVTPNPLNPSGVLSFRTARDGYVRVRMFDLNGRLVRVLADHPLATAGDQEIRIDGRGAHGETLASGAYFYVVETPEGKTRGRIMILK